MKKQLIVVFSVMLALVFGFSFTAKADDISNIYIVKNGDTLSGIAQKHQTSWQQLQRINHISNPNLIFVGQEIRLVDTGNVNNQTAEHDIQKTVATYSVYRNTDLKTQKSYNPQKQAVVNNNPKVKKETKQHKKNNNVFDKNIIVEDPGMEAPDNMPQQESKNNTELINKKNTDESYTQIIDGKKMYLVDPDIDAMDPGYINKINSKRENQNNTNQMNKENPDGSYTQIIDGKSVRLSDPGMDAMK